MATMLDRDPYISTVCDRGCEHERNADTRRTQHTTTFGMRSEIFPHIIPDGGEGQCREHTKLYFTSEEIERPPDLPLDKLEDIYR